MKYSLQHASRNEKHYIKNVNQTKVWGSLLWYITNSYVNPEKGWTLGTFSEQNIS